MSGWGLEGVLQEDLRVLELHFGIVLEHLPAAKRLVFAAFAIDRDSDVTLLLAQFLGGGSKRGFQGAENDVLADTLLIGYRINNQQNFFAHRSGSLCYSRPARIRS